MKTRIIFILSLAFILTSCSKDALDEPILNSDANQNTSEVIDKDQSQPIEISELGFFEVVKSNGMDCSNSTQIFIYGEGKEVKLGRFTTTATYCTNFSDENYIEGIHSFSRIDKLFFSSKVSGEDRLGKWFEYEYLGGTGKFAKAKGLVKVYVETELNESSLEEKYSSYGFGRLSF